MSKSLVLYFHDEVDGDLFEKVIIALKARYQLVSAPELEALLLQKASLKNICHITFDDGLRSFYDIVFPIIKKHSVPVSLFLSPNIIGNNKNFWFQEIEGYDSTIIKEIIAKQWKIEKQKIERFNHAAILKSLTYAEIDNIINIYQQQTKTPPKPPLNMSLTEVLDVDKSGLVSIGAHTLNHPILKNEDDKSCKAEISQSIKKLAELIQQPVKYFAYPNGRPGIDFGEREISCLKENGISMSFSTELNTLSANTNILSVPRMSFARMGLSLSNPLIYFRLSLGKKWLDIKSIGKPSEKSIREKIKAALDK